MREERRPRSYVPTLPSLRENCNLAPNNKLTVQASQKSSMWAYLLQNTEFRTLRSGRCQT